MTSELRDRLLPRRGRPGIGPTDTLALVVAPTAERVLEVALLVLLAGYMLFDRGFAWIHVPGTPLFVGETVLSLGFLALATTHVRVEGLARASTPLFLQACFMAWCLIRTVPGIPEHGVNAIRDLAIAYYGIFAWLVAILLIRRPERLQLWIHRYLLLSVGALLWFGPALLLSYLFAERPPFVPDSGVSIFSHGNPAVAIHAVTVLLLLWLLEHDTEAPYSRRRIMVTALVVPVVAVAGLLSRGGLLAVCGGLAVLWLLDQRSTGAMFSRVAVIGVIFFVLAWGFDLRISVFSNSREISAQQLIDNVVSVVSPSSADDDLTGTADWRMQYWRRLVADVTQRSPLDGLGFGTNLRERFGEQDEEVPARDAHNSHIGIYARSGLIGLALWTVLWWSWFAHVLQARRRARASGDVRTANLAGILIAIAIAHLVNAFFDPALEGPQVAVWVWTLFGIGALLGRGLDVLEPDDGSDARAIAR